jgi:hypothetical protein
LKIYLRPSFFSDKEKPLLEIDKLRVSLFNYESGVEAVRIRSELWEMIWLPYLWQQIWDFSVRGKSIKMQSPVYCSYAVPVSGGRDNGSWRGHS